MLNSFSNCKSCENTLKQNETILCKSCIIVKFIFKMNQMIFEAGVYLHCQIVTSTLGNLIISFRG